MIAACCALGKVGQGRQRSVDARFEAMTGQYLFEPEFCKRGAGWEKGVIEKNVQHRRKDIWRKASERRRGDAWRAQRVDAAGQRERLGGEESPSVYAVHVGRCPAVRTSSHHAQLSRT